MSLFEVRQADEAAETGIAMRLMAYNGGVSAETVILGDSGQVQGDITAKNIVVGGKVTGNIIASENLELQQHSQVFGDVRASKLHIAEGAVFEGLAVLLEL